MDRYLKLKEKLNINYQRKQTKLQSKNDKLRYDIAAYYIKNLEEWDKKRMTFYDFSMIDKFFDVGDPRASLLEKHKKRLGYSSLTDDDFKKIIFDIQNFNFSEEYASSLISQGTSIDELYDDMMNSLKKMKNKKYEDTVYFYSEKNPKSWEEEGRDLFYYLAAEKPVDIFGKSTSNSVMLPGFILRPSGYEVFNKQDYIDLIKEIDGDFDPNYQLDPNFKCHNFYIFNKRMS